MAELRLWSEDLEPLRAEARETHDKALTLFAEQLGPVDMPPAERLAYQRERYSAVFKPTEGPTPELSDRVIAGRHCRVFVPARPPVGLYVQIHGGGWSLGSPEDGDADNLRRCRELGLVIVSPKYRLAPEHPYPAAFEDVMAVVEWLLENAEREWGVGARMVIGGGSAGGHITAGTVLRIRDDLHALDRVAGMNLVIGVYDMTSTPSLSGVRCADGADLLDQPVLQMYFDDFLPGLSAAQRRDPHISPMYADLRPMPRALITAGLDDHCLDDSLFFAQRLAAAGNQVDLRVYPDCFHGFTVLPTAMAARAHAVIDEFLVECLAEG
jgi:acetyl esterase